MMMDVASGISAFVCFPGPVRSAQVAQFQGRRSCRQEEWLCDNGSVSIDRIA